MSGRTSLVVVAVSAIVAIAACSQGGTAPSVGGANGAASPITDAGSSPAEPTPEAVPETAPASEAAASPDPGVGGVCTLVSAEEVAGIVGVSASPIENDPNTCIYEVPDTSALVALTQIFDDGAAQFSSMKAGPEATPVSGLGDDAFWLRATEAVQLHILDGDAMVVVAIGTLSGVPVDELTGLGPEELLAKAKAYAEVALGRR